MDKAIEHLQEAVHLNPADPYAHHNLANAYRNHRGLRKAEEHMLQAKRLRDEYDDVKSNESPKIILLRIAQMALDSVIISGSRGDMRGLGKRGATKEMSLAAKICSRRSGMHGMAWR